MAELATGMRAYVIIGLLAVLSAAAGVFTLPPLDRDESRYAQATAQMLESGDFIRINFLDTPRNKKPAGIYWMQAAAVSLFSDSESRAIWAYRLPSILGALFAALACFWGGSRLIGREAAFAGSALFAVTALLGIEGGIAKTDAMLVATTTLAMASLANLRSGDGGRKSAMLFWFAIGLGLLIKGPITPMVAGLTLVALAIWERRLNWMKPLLFIPGPLLAIAMFVPWFIAIQTATDGAFLRESLGQDMLGKVGEGQERHGGLPGYYLSLLPLLFFPATLFLIPGIARLVETLRLKVDNHAADTARFLIAWVVPTWLVFELTSTKLPHYVLPTFPALALIAGWGLMELGKAAPWQRWTSWGIFAVGALLSAIIFPAIAIIGSNTASWDAVRLSMAGFQGGFELGIDEATIAIVLAGAVVFALVAGAALPAERRAGVLALVLAVAAGLSWQVMARTTSLPNAYAARLADQVRGAREYSQTIAGVSPDEIVTASSFTEPSLVFSLGSDTVLGTAEEVLAFAESREEPTMIVLDLSRDAELRTFMTMPETMAWSDLEPMLARYAALRICHETLASGTNYSRGDETVLAILFATCATTEEIPRDPIQSLE
jgi:4-amino-4-deoxy-L-arabinose transferase-like glycosyltransferase